MILLPRHFRSQPAIVNEILPYFKGQNLSVMNAALQGFDVVSRQQWGYTNWSGTPFGIAGQGPTSGSLYGTLLPNSSTVIPTGTQFTFLMAGKFSQSVYPAVSVGTQAANSWEFNFYPSFSGTTYFRWGGSTDGVTSVQGTAPDLSLYHVFLLSAGPAGMQIWCDGVLIGSNSATPSRASSSSQLQVAERTSYTQSINLVATWAQQFPKSVNANLSINPWQIYKKQPAKLFAAPALPVTTVTPIPIKRAWTSQPQVTVGVDWSNPLTQGLSAAFDLNSSRDLITQATPSVNTSTRTVKNQKVGRAFAAGTNTQFPHRSNFALTGPMTALVVLDINTLSDYTAILTKQATSTTFNIYELRGTTPTGSGLTLLEGRGSDYAVWDSPSGVISAGFSGVVGFTRDADTATGTRNFYSNGKKFAGTASRLFSGVITDDGSSPVYLGTRSDNITKLNGNIYLAVLWSRVLSDSEIASFTNNPWQIFKKQPLKLFAAPALPTTTVTPIPIKRAWTSQPQGPVQIDWGNPLTAGLTDWVDLRPLIARNALPTGKNVTSQASAITSSAGQGGIGLRFPGGTTDGKLSVGGNGDYTQQSQSWVVICSPRTLATHDVNGNILVSKHDPSSSIKGFTFYVDSTAVGAQIKGANSGIAASVSLSVDALKPPVSALGISFNSSAFRVAANGKVSADSTSPSFSINVDFPLNIGDAVDTFWNTFDGVIYAVFGWVGKTLTPTELAEVTRNPWQFFKKQPLKLFSGAAASGAQTLTPSLFTNNQTFYSPTVTPGAVTLTPGLYENGQTFYAPTVAAGAVTLTPALYTNDQIFYGPTVAPGAVTLTPGLYTNDQTYYGPTVTQSAAAQTLTPSLYENNQTFYGPTVSPGAVTLTPGLYENANAFYGPTITQATVQTILPDLFVNTNTIFLPVVDDGTRVVSIADVGAEDARRKKRQKKRDKEFALLKQEQDKLRKEIERVIDPVVEQSQPVIVSPADREVRVLSVSGNKVAVTVPESLDVAQVAREIAQIFEQSRIKATIVERAAQTQQALAQAQEEYRRKMRRRRDDELLLLMD